MPDAPSHTEHNPAERVLLENLMNGLSTLIRPEDAKSYLKTVYEDVIPTVPDREHRPGVSMFLLYWRKASPSFGMSAWSGNEVCYAPLWPRPDIIRAEDVDKYGDDLQAIDWHRLGQSKSNARTARRELYYCQKESKVTPPPYTPGIPSAEPFFQFHLMNTKPKPVIEHFQLRNTLVRTSHVDIFYAGTHEVLRTDLHSSMTARVLDLTSSNSPRQKATRFRITTLAATDNLLLAGGFHGDYALLNLHSSSPTPIRGMISQAKNAITNHAHFFSDRQSGQARLYTASNDYCLRTLDCTTGTVLSTNGHHSPVNCAATSPDSRLRVLVGDFPGSSIIDANTGSLLTQLPSSIRDAFACAWSDNGIHVATAAQDNRVIIWDARRWDTPLAVMPTELDCVRVLRFSPLAGGLPVLVAAEAADYVHVLDAVSFGERQVLEFFGNVAGVTFDGTGEELVVANGDARFGGLMSWRRCRGGSLARPMDLFAAEEMRWNLSRRMVSEQWMGSVERSERIRGPLKECDDLLF
jgi:hypothetical protein